MAPKAAEKKRATIDDPVNALDRKSGGSTSGLRLVRQWSDEEPDQDGGSAERTEDDGRAPTPVAALDDAEGEQADTGGGEDDTERVGPFRLVTRDVGESAPSDDEARPGRPAR